MWSLCSSITKPVLIYKLYAQFLVSYIWYSVEIYQIVICLQRIRVLIRHYIYDYTFWMSLSIILSHCFLGILELNWVLPYADDFCLITTDLRKHQKIQNEIKSKIESMGMRLKPAKCTSFSIRSGVPSRINFTIGETEIPNIFQEEQKFLGNFYFLLVNLVMCSITSRMNLKQN